MPVDRHRARILAMQALCQWDVQPDETPDALRALLDTLEAGEDEIRCASEIVETFWSTRQGIDDRITAAAHNWELSRISPVDRNVMRVAIVEFLTESVPPKVALDEAIEIAKEFGGAESPRFVNGVLDTVLRRILSKTKSKSDT